MVELSPEIPVIAIKDKLHHHQLRMAQTTTQVLHPLEGGSLVIAHLFHQGIGQMIIHDLPKHRETNL
jgi:hypothetical protein